ncbi:hypothetical protein GQ607_009435 [Colletotrichum asianum]|uniref:Uncharacterized protein n=1 Tax=Colletotrichum asianum TaxID=702518 RepID=A0A8H3ZPV8_9PEZI|nr:hypothetical protein GQ607_009435 [Colletotrichum asianum]
MATDEGWNSAKLKGIFPIESFRRARRRWQQGCAISSCVPHLRRRPVYCQTMGCLSRGVLETKEDSPNSSSIDLIRQDQQPLQPVPRSSAHGKSTGLRRRPSNLLLRGGGFAPETANCSTEASSHVRAGCKCPSHRRCHGWPQETYPLKKLIRASFTSKRLWSFRCPVPRGFDGSPI